MESGWPCFCSVAHAAHVLRTNSTGPHDSTLSTRLVLVTQGRREECVSKCKRENSKTNRALKDHDLLHVLTDMLVSYLRQQECK